jgi:phosphoglycolate phosphatase
MIERGLELERRASIPGEIDRMLGDFLAYYGAHLADRSRAFPGLVAALDCLAAHGCEFAVCTNKFESLSRQLLDALGLSQRFKAICGQDTFGIQKPDPGILRRTIAAAGGSIERTLMVGDSGIDVATARAASIKVVAVDFGYSDPPVALLNPDRLISHYDDLPAAVIELSGL